MALESDFRRIMDCGSVAVFSFPKTLVKSFLAWTIISLSGVLLVFFLFDGRCSRVGGSQLRRDLATNWRIHCRC
ncbi:hypothetical protein VTK73DRAFT_10198 [Phialemonium thermophilum]|uniref:Uncharacterized protein n=1 Tax=Phialemonium thermophilum TaxID=223376 RepID=A0ABR3XH64_9PEZI